MALVLFLVAGVVALPFVALCVWRLQARVVAMLVPGVDLLDVAAVADGPLVATLGQELVLIGGTPVHLLTVVREAALLFVAYRPVTPEGARVTTLLLDVTGAGAREIAVLWRWRSVRTSVLVRADDGDGMAAIQDLSTRLTVTLPICA